MLVSPILNSVTFKNVSGSFPTMWNRIHTNRTQPGKKNLAYLQEFPNGHTLYLQFESTESTPVTLKSFECNVEIASVSQANYYKIGTTYARYYFNFTVTLPANKQFSFSVTQGANILYSEPVKTSVITDRINSGALKYIKYTNLDRIDSDLDNGFIDWSSIPGNYLDMFIEATDHTPNDKDEVEVLQGSQSQTIVSAAYYSGRTLKTGAIPDYLATRLGMASSLDRFFVNDVQYIKTGDIDQDSFGNSTLYQVSIKMIRKDTIGVNVDNIGGETTPEVIPPVLLLPMYVGAITDENPTEAIILGMNSLLIAEQSVEYFGIIEASRCCFAYPETYGLLSGIADRTGFDVLSAFTNSTVVVNGINYTVYTMKRKITNNSMDNYIIKYMP